MIQTLAFRPLIGLSSPHAQTILSCFSRGGVPPPSVSLNVLLEDGDHLCCEISTPINWDETQKTIVLVHGLGGSSHSSYMVRLGRKLYKAGYQVVRVNLRGCGPGKLLARKKYYGGSSHDILQLLRVLKHQYPRSPLVLAGFSIGGNIVLKLAGELGEEADRFLHLTIAVCPPIDLANTIEQLEKPTNQRYHRYFVKGLHKLLNHPNNNYFFSSLFDFDRQITAPQWGFQDPHDYYQKCSSRYFLPSIRHACHLLFAADDPFIDYRSLLELSLAPSVKTWVSPHGGHVGFLGWAGREHRWFWMDRQLMHWIQTS